MRIEVTLPPSDLHPWTEEFAASAVGKPFRERPYDGKVIGEIVEARLEEGALVLGITIDDVAVEVDLRRDTLNEVAMIPTPRYRAR